MLSSCALVLLTGVIILVVADRGSRAGTQTLADELFKNVSQDAVAQTRDYVLSAAPVAESLARLSGKGLVINDLDQLAPQLLAFLEANPGLTWVLYGDESGDYTGATRLRNGEVHIERTHITNGHTHLTDYLVQPNGSWKIDKQDNNSGYDPRARPFYILAKQRGKLSWTPPYMFFTQGVPGISCVIPVYRVPGQLRGVFSVEFDLNALSKFVGNLTISQHSRVFLFTPNLILLAHPNLTDIEGKGVKGKGALLTLAETGDTLVEAFRKHLPSEYTHSAGNEKYHFYEFDHDGESYMASTTVFPIGDGQSWVVGAIAPEADFLASVWRTRWLALWAAAVTLLLTALMAALLSRHISQPVQSLITFMNRVGAGDLQARADFHGGREFRQLADALNRMIVDLRERLQLRHSLDVAMEVQQSLLPESDPISPRLDIAGRSIYCDQTGGDYYDFIDVAPLSPSTMLIAVGDVMGHGIAAALLMASARAALRSSAMRSGSLGTLLTHTNAVLAKDNRHNRFMTLALIEINSESGAITWASAGHDPPIIYEPRTDTFHEPDGGDLPLGVADAVQFEDYSAPPLTTGCIMAIGTDGVWEMHNEHNELYGKERLRQVVRDQRTKTAKEIAAALEADLASFRGKRSPLDDVTFVIMKYK